MLFNKIEGFNINNVKERVNTEIKYVWVLFNTDTGLVSSVKLSPLSDSTAREERLGFVIKEVSFESAESKCITLIICK